MKRKYKSALGLHTAEEQSEALGIATGAYQQAVASLNDGDLRGFLYLSGIQGLASAEKKAQLVNDIQVLRERLVEMEKAIA